MLASAAGSRAAVISLVLQVSPEAEGRGWEERQLWPCRSRPAKSTGKTASFYLFCWVSVVIMCLGIRLSLILNLADNG